jgi:hypothetical protein
MMDFRGWTFPTPDSMYLQSDSQSPFASNISSYFRRPTKVVKPNSRTVSPKHAGRRRTTSNLSVTRTRSLLDKQRSSTHQPQVISQQSRPLSWHPNSVPDFMFPQQSTLSDLSYLSYPQFMHGTTAVNGLVTPVSYPLPDEPQIQELITPLEELSAQEAGPHYPSTNYTYPQWVAQDYSKNQGYAMDNMFPQQMMPQTWQYLPMQNNMKVPTAPSSPVFLPIQGGVEASPLSLDIEHIIPPANEGEELVGMGLYDSPADVRSSSLLFGGGLTGNGPKRSLKLEESFEPAPESSDAEDENGEEDGEEPEEEEDQEEDFEDPTARDLPASQQQLMDPIPSMSGQSFFFESEADVNNHLYLQAQYPAYPAVYAGGSWL